MRSVAGLGEVVGQTLDCVCARLSENVFGVKGEDESLFRLGNANAFLSLASCEPCLRQCSFTYLFAYNHTVLGANQHVLFATDLESFTP
jgi:hypothetical protein